MPALTVPRVRTSPTLLPAPLKRTHHALPALVVSTLPPDEARTASLAKRVASVARSAPPCLVKATALRATTAPRAPLPRRKSRARLETIALLAQGWPRPVPLAGMVTLHSFPLPLAPGFAPPVITAFKALQAPRKTPALLGDLDQPLAFKVTPARVHVRQGATVRLRGQHLLVWGPALWETIVRRAPSRQTRVLQAGMATPRA